MSNARIRLRPLRREDSDLLFQWINDRELRIYGAPHYPVTDDEHERWMESMLKGRDDAVLFMIEHIADERPIGSVQLKDIKWVHRRAEIQGKIGERDYWGQGLGSEAFRALIRFAFDDLNLHRVEGKVFANNPRSLEACKNAGFVEEGRSKDKMYIDGKYLDVIHIGVVDD